MNNKKTLNVIWVLILLIVTPILISTSASAVIVEPYASYYLDSYGAYVYPAGNSLVQVYFDVEGTGYMDEIGSLSIEIYECPTNSSDIRDWTWKETFKHNSTSGMLSYNDDFHSSHVDYSGTTGKYYKAYVCVWAGKNGDGDTRYFWTSAKKAT